MMSNRLAAVNRLGSIGVNERRVATAAELRALAHPLRLRILREVLDTPRTNAEIADRLGVNPATCLHHVRTLLGSGFIEPATPRAGVNGITEKPYKATKKSWHTDFDQAPGGAQPLARAALDAFIAEASGPLAELSTSRLGVRLTEKHRHRFETKLEALLREIARADRPDGERWAIFIATHRRET